ncbi:MAG: UDP-N-acetylglucosamine--N-acetylmuramyl-(pentapeptide) pyrophosphoryl-undecaprenol N-acetylglucosamine transferase [Candidatus Coproplasma sp.]
MKKIVFCGGGSAGHVIPNVAIIESLPPQFSFCYLGTCGIEKKICSQNGIPFYEFDGVKLTRGKLLCNLSIPFKLAKSIRQCKKILKSLSPAALFCKGGYASLPPALAASKLKIPVITHESDISMGLANKIIARRAALILTSFPQTAQKYSNALCTGSPMRKELFGKNAVTAKERLGLDMRPTILVFGGGSGSVAINNALRKIIIKLCKKYNVVHICGEGNLIKSKIYGYIQLEYCSDMGSLYACADYAVARCGSNSAFELIAQKIPTLFIPLDNGATRGDQIENANYFNKKGLCRVLAEKNLTPEMLDKELNALIADEELKTALRKDDTQCGTNNVINAIMSVVKS